MNKIIFSNDQLFLIEKSYEKGTSSEVLAKQLNVSPQTIVRTLKHHGIKLKKTGSFNRKYFFDETYFDNINSEDKAYWLGFIAADGYVAPNGLSISLSQDDQPHLELFAKDINYTGPLVIKKSVCKKIWKGKYLCRLDANSMIMMDSLRQYFDSNKTFSLDFLKIKKLLPCDLMRHFIRGYFDGDGCWNSSGKYSQRFIFTCASRDRFLGELQLFLNEKLELPLNKIMSTKNSKASILAYTGKRQCIKFYNYIYHNAAIFLTRKKEKAQSFLFN